MPALVGVPPPPDAYAAFRQIGVASDNSFTSQSVTFRFIDLEDMQPGSVLITDVVGNGEEHRSVSVDEFDSLGKHLC
ncbi:hypothetical protein AB0869_07055 [Micromonospora vinacea]|uniref:hypothetical protein n=1 Tax=Micromonospora vinacea TaxID=709878 RepID=UPI0034536E51